jgi:hypothetical protein
MKAQYVYVVIDLTSNEVVTVYKNRDDIDDEYYHVNFSIQHVYFWK